MIRCLLMSVTTLFLLGGCVVSNVESRGPSRGAQSASEKPVLRHGVLLSFKEGTTPEDIKTVVDAFRGLRRKIWCIADLAWGTDVSPEKKSEGFTHCFQLTFRGEAERDDYLVDPAHKEFGKTLHPHLAKVLVVDYWAQR
jgi:hypothetical protein